MCRETDSPYLLSWDPHIFWAQGRTIHPGRWQWRSSQCPQGCPRQWVLLWTECSGNTMRKKVVRLIQAGRFLLQRIPLRYLLLYSEDSQVQKTPVQKTIPGIGLEHLGILHSVYVQLVQFMHSTRVMMTTEACTGKMHTQQNKKGNILNHKWTICFITKL